MNDSLATIAEDFTRIAGRDADHSWAGAALLVLLQGRLAPGEVRRILSQARDLVAASGESADDVLGDPREWAREQLAEQSLAGAAFTDDDASGTDLVVVGLLLATVVAVMWGVISLLQGQWTTSWSLAMLLAPLLLGALTTGTITLRERLVHRFSNAVSLALTLLVGTPLTLAAGWFLVSRPVPLGRASSLWWFALAAALAGLTWLAGRVLPDAMPRRVRTSALLDEQWLAEARTKLRDQGSLKEQEISALLDEARQHAQQAGTSLAEEFGNPVGYAGTLPTNPRRASARQVTLWFVLAIFWGGLALHDPGISTGLAAAGAGIAAVLQLANHLRKPAVSS